MSKVTIGRASRPWGQLFLALGLGLAGMTAGCRVPAPKPQAWLQYGFGSPGQAFRSFATCVQGRMLDALYDSLSIDFKERNGLSRTGFGEAWDILEDANPLLRYALYQATKDPEKLTFRRFTEDRCVVETSYRGHALQVLLVRSGYWEVYSEDPAHPERDAEREQDGALVDLFGEDPVAGMALREDAEADPRLFTYSPIPIQGMRTLSSQRSGYEWKVDNFAFEKL